MKKHRLFLTLLLATSLAGLTDAFGQTPSNCNVPPALFVAYESDVRYMALKSIYTSLSPDTSEIDISSVYTDAIWKGLAAIYNAGPAVEADSVFDVYCIHDILDGEFIRSRYDIDIVIDTNYAWNHNWRHLVTLTGMPQMDNFLALYGIYVHTYYAIWQHIELKTHQVYNTKVIADSLRTFPGITFVHTPSNYGANTYIKYSSWTIYKYYEFNLGWGDCQAGCICNRTWRYRVDTTNWSVTLYSKTSYCSIHENTSISNCQISTNPASYTLVYPEICFGSTYFVAGQNQSLSGIYFDTLTSVGGNDSIIVTHLQVWPNFQSNQYFSICQGDSMLIGGNYQHTAGIYNDSLQTEHGCDSILIKHLNILPAFSFNENETICQGESLPWHWQNLTAAGTYYDNYTTVNGCDSIYTLNLVVNSLPVVSFSGLNAFYCVYDPSVTLTGSPTGGTFSGGGISGNTFDPNVAGAGTYDIIYSYTDGNLCTNSDTNTVVVDLCIGVNEINANSIAIYPNPSSGSFTLELGESASVEIYNAVGSLIYCEAFVKGKHTISLEQAKGIYLIKARSGSISRNVRMVIQ